MRHALILLGIALLVFVAGLWLAGSGRFGEIDGVAVDPAGEPRARALGSAIAIAQNEAAARVGAEASSQILFGDFHVHTTLSSDAFLLNLPMMGGAGAMTPADACDFARHCAALDFWSINDHANSLYPEDWANTIDAIRACNERAGDPANPDMVSFLGWEWTQAGLTAQEHYGHKNVVLAHTDDARIPARPIAAKAGPMMLGDASPLLRGAASLLDGRFADLSRRIAAHQNGPVCGEGHTRDLDTDCREVAPTPPELFRKLDEWDHDALVIPHGTAWGVYTPPDSDWAKQLAGTMQNAKWQTMIEVYSGHGDSEVYRDWRAFDLAADGARTCPEETPDYLPACRQAGRIVEARCLAQGENERVCAGRAELARQHALAAGKDYVNTIEESTPFDWRDAAQCRDCDQGAYNYVPTGSAQYIMALGNFDEDVQAPRRFRFGFMASSDNHSARPGTGYKELRSMTDGGYDRPERGGVLAGAIRSSGRGDGSEGLAEKPAHSKSIVVGETSPIAVLNDAERASSFQFTGGLVAVHASGRDRASIWEALEANSVYGTSGPRILLWFDLLTSAGELGMGTQIVAREAPTLRVRAVGSFEQKPGCPADTINALEAETLERLCLGECDHPSDERRPIERIDVVRIRPQTTPNEDVGPLIDDPWRSFECDGGRDGCVATFTDDEFTDSGRDALYYARVYEAAKPTANASILACERDEAGGCPAITLCEDDSDCLAPDRPRAWSSPIFVDHPDARRTR